ncbi:sigma-54-dependent transcriptional regulator [Flexistipes sp.]|uniref:sigma-54-dependent transcriptional regulator n=1 Tax=Flexistipes sp. TaxID=3088135 RepID=UPI002E21F1BD|nr:sigma-54 dependent transcriptional regulator [Flexistipes sp.]
MDKKILIVDDEKNHRLMLKIHLADEGFEVLEAENGVEALQLIDESDFDLILLDIKMDIMDGFTFLSHMRQKDLHIPVIVITAFSNVKTAVQAMKLGAVDFISKPVDTDNLLDLVKNNLKTRSDKSVSGADNVLKDYVFDGVYSEEGLGKIIEMLKMVAPTDATVLITGESGTGKELVAKSIHDNSHRKNGPFLAVNCAALNENLIESEMFGHEKGAFTGAVSQKKGKFELADKGTLFLDEVAELPLPTQAKLLRALQEKVFERVGGEKSIRTNVRIVAATNRNIKEMVNEGGFREDLFFRLNVFPINLPPLRERKSEIPMLVKFFIDKYSHSFNKLIRGYTDSYMQKLMRFDFTGNIRELSNLVERSIILCTSDKLDAVHLPEPEHSDFSEDSAMDVRGNERNLIAKALKQTNGNKTKAAEILGISRRTLHNKIKEYEIEV